MPTLIMSECVRRVRGDDSSDEEDSGGELGHAVTDVVLDLTSVPTLTGVRRV